MSKKIRIILAESQELLRKSLISLLQANHEFEIVGEAKNGRELIDLLKQVEADIVIMEVEMPVMDGKSALDIIVQRFSKTKVIALSANCEAASISDIMSSGSSSFLTKNCAVETLVHAIKTVHLEGYYFDISTSKAMLETLSKGKLQNAGLNNVSFNIREKEILKRICDGKTNKEISLSLNLSMSTIDYYRTKIYFKTKCNTIADVVKYALKEGIVSLS